MKKEEKMKKLKELIQDVEIAMLTTLDQGLLRSRPMALLEVEDLKEEVLWFFTSKSSAKSSEIEEDAQVNLSFSKPEKQKLMTSLSSNDIVKIASLAGNQRRRIQPHLFKSEQVNVGTKVLFFDDSMFSGSTLNAVKQQYPIHEVFVIFKK